MGSECAFHVEEEAGAVGVVHFGGEDVEGDAEAFAVGEGDGDGGVGLGGCARDGGEDGHVVLVAGLLDEAVEQGGGIGAFAVAFRADVQGEGHGSVGFVHVMCFFY